MPLLNDIAPEGFVYDFTYVPWQLIEKNNENDWQAENHWKQNSNIAGHDKVEKTGKDNNSTSHRAI